MIGTGLAPSTLYIDAGRLRLFAKAIGEPNPTDVVPPTFLFAIELEQPDPFAWLAELGVDLRKVLHGEQSFVYHSPARAGDTLTATPRITDTYQKKGGALTFIVKETAVTRADGSAVADLKTVVVVRK
ncbi:MaoC family dehydratase N-terminal domain-containing protein [Nocardia puris]|uniref:MaoC dehydratase-like protein n=1 Tax=Nocardia puris TaxID=208602 RepID=A0A366E2B7_9NOCA|nr:MaoC family dehydratase N-terminal domain-containing protein [Nocardia puris]MBF6212671.1 MaoC family dehydratase N-terminal domain-containing protein [Nocardia puris]MBF6367609.1 MaoC family dehydratase N-terminal domain-containing protein [Nocardia puris]MBF6461260.1 MaoC family dehydratase N-terminal domain-containing protein [Nocardia puris]RBO96511.1 MaoC dehydratase-like protein [Nocardia puris]